MTQNDADNLAGAGNSGDVLFMALSSGELAAKDLDFGFHVRPGRLLAGVVGNGRDAKPVPSCSGSNAIAKATQVAVLYPVTHASEFPTKNRVHRLATSRCRLATDVADRNVQPHLGQLLFPRPGPKPACLRGRLREIEGTQVGIRDWD